jgi:hypothetical protein
MSETLRRVQALVLAGDYIASYHVMTFESSQRMISLAKMDWEASAGRLLF